MQISPFCVVTGIIKAIHMLPIVRKHVNSFYTVNKMGIFLPIKHQRTMMADIIPSMRLMFCWHNMHHSAQKIHFRNRFVLKMEAVFSQIHTEMRSC